MKWTEQKVLQGSYLATSPSCICKGMLSSYVAMLSQSFMHQHKQQQSIKPSFHRGQFSQHLLPWISALIKLLLHSGQLWELHGKVSCSSFPIVWKYQCRHLEGMIPDAQQKHHHQENHLLSPKPSPPPKQKEHTDQPKTISRKTCLLTRRMLHVSEHRAHNMLCCQKALDQKTQDEAVGLKLETNEQ